MKMFSQQARGQHFCGHSQMFLTTLDRTHDGSFRGFSQFPSAALSPCRPGMGACWCPRPLSFVHTAVTPQRQPTRQVGPLFQEAQRQVRP